MHEYLDPVVLAKIEDLELIARTVVEGFLGYRLHQSPYVVSRSNSHRIASICRATTSGI